MTDSETLAAIAAALPPVLANQLALIGGNSDFLTGAIDDPDSFDAGGAKAGPLGYYPMKLADGTTGYVPCLARMLVGAHVVTGAPGLPETLDLGSKAGTLRTYTFPRGARGGQWSGDTVEVIDQGSGVDQGPSVAAFGRKTFISRDNWNTNTTAQGEMDAEQVYVRQGIGDGMARLTNVVGRVGLFAADESFTGSADATGAILKSVRTQTAIVNSREGGEYGFVAQAVKGAALTAAFHSADIGAASFDHVLHHVAPNGTLRCYIRAADGAYLGGSVLPIEDGGANVGAPSARFLQVYAINGAIQTSDLRLKHKHGPLTSAEIAAAREIGASMCTYQMIAAIEAKGDAAARWHVGVIAQEVIAILQAHSLDPMRYGFVCHDAWDAVEEVAARPATISITSKGALRINPGTPGTPSRAAGDLYAIRYDELSMFVLAGQHQWLKAQDERVAALEAKLA